MSRYESKLEDKMDDEIKLVGLESLVPKKLEKHLILNSNRFRTFEDARMEFVTFVEAKFGLRIRDPKPSGAGVRGHNPLYSSKEKRSSVPCVGCLKCDGAHFQRDCNVRKSTGKQSFCGGKQSK